MLDSFFQIIYKILLRGMDYLRGLFFYIKVCSCGGEVLGLPKIGNNLTFKYPPHKGIKIGKNFSMGPGCIIDVPLSGSLVVGNNVKITSGVYVSAASSIVIGDDVLIAEGVSIRDSDHLFFSDELIRMQNLQYGSIKIYNDVWIGCGSAILMNSTISKGCIVGARSVVRKKILDENGIYVGAPVKKISQRVSRK